ncbi:PilZ domain-containing protein [Paenibacillus frigoriresistens]|uniref:PilZ domain-containing protein n=1 Tax=Paenibacillus alginolyticus TaxID=59839 RepID=UPI0015665523|nr:PilZ domain-containing protein [Paenibacillus frigoriresistens]NRF95573.1 PilZ domain-containing protein [Paenibacillus frigoriresistens]
MGKRRQERTYTVPLEIVIEEVVSSYAQYENVPISIMEVSEDGMRFSTKVELLTEDTIYFRLPSIDDTELITGRVAWKQEIEAGLFIYGIQILG